MPDTKITALTAIGANPIIPSTFPIPMVDLTDTSMAASGTTKKVTVNQILGAGGTATLASATITGDLTVATDRLKVVTASTAIQTGATTQLQVGTTSWPSSVIGKSGSRSLFGNAGEVIIWNESAAAIGNYSTLFVSAKTGAGATTMGGLQIRAGIENASNSDGFVSLWTSNNTAGGFVERYKIDSTGVSTWSVSGSTAMTLNSTGLLVGTTTMPSGVTFARLVAKSTSGDWSGVIWNSNATPYGFRIQHDTDSNGTGNEFLYCLGGANLRASIRSNGGIANYQANDVSLSDSRLKTDIKPLASYWNKIKSLELVTFKYKDQTHSDDNIGLIAQQVESVAPELVDVDGFGETPDDGVPLKTIYTTDLYHAAIKALQEAMARIEAMEAKLA